MNKNRNRSGWRPPDEAPRAPVSALTVDTPTREQLALALPGEEQEPASRLFVEVFHAAPVEPTPELPKLSEQPALELEPESAPRPAVNRPATTVGSIGTRLRAAREARGLALADVARQLRIPAAKVAEIEADAFGSNDLSVFMRGYLKSYARLLDLPQVIITKALEQFDAPPPALVATQTVSRSHYLASRYGNSLVYIVLTAVVIVPLLWMARQGSLMPSPGVPQLESLDTASNVELAVPRTDEVSGSEVRDGSSNDAAPYAVVGPPESRAPQPAVQDAPPQPVRAAMTPMPESTAPVSQRVVLTLAQASWVELLGADGERIEYGLLPAGTHREYQVSGPASLHIGNTRGAALEVNGNPVALAPFSHANVARVTLSETMEPASPQ